MLAGVPAFSDLNVRTYNADGAAGARAPTYPSGSEGAEQGGPVNLPEEGTLERPLALTDVTPLAFPRSLGGWKARLSANGLAAQISQVWLGATLANVLLYAFHVMSGRALGPQDYGLFSALFGIVYLGGAASNAVQVSIARYVATGRTTPDGQAAGPIVTSALAHMLLAGVAIIMVVSLAAPLIGSYLRIGSTGPIVLLGGLLALGLLMPVTQGALLGSERFGWFAGALIVNAGGRLVLGLLALAFGLGVVGLLGAVGLASLSALGLGLAVTRPPLALERDALPVKPLASALAPALLAFLVVALPTSADVVIVRHFFPATEAGLYAGAAVLGRIILFLPLAISLVLFPKTTQHSALGNPTAGLLRKGLAMTACLSGSVALTFMLSPGAAISFVLGPEYLDAASTVRLYAAAMFLFSLAVVFLYYHLATGRTGYFYYLLLPHVVLELGLLYVLHGSLTQVVLVLLTMNASLVVTSYAYTRWAGEATASPAAGLEGSYGQVA